MTHLAFGTTQPPRRSVKKFFPAAAAVAMLTMAATAQAGGTLTLDGIIPVGVQNSMVVGLSGTTLGHSGLSGTIDIGQFSGDGTEATGFQVQGGLVSAAEVGGIFQVLGVSATPINSDPSALNPISSGTGDFDATGVGLVLDSGTIEIPAFALVYDLSVEPITIPGSGTGTVITNSVNAGVYNITVQFPIALQIDIAPEFNVFAQFDGFIVATGDVTVTAIPEPTSSALLAGLAARLVIRRRRNQKHNTPRRL